MQSKVGFAKCLRVMSQTVSDELRQDISHSCSTGAYPTFCLGAGASASVPAWSMPGTGLEQRSLGVKGEREARITR